MQSYFHQYGVVGKMNFFAAELFRGQVEGMKLFDMCGWCSQSMLSLTQSRKDGKTQRSLMDLFLASLGLGDSAFLSVLNATDG